MKVVEFDEVVEALIGRRFKMNFRTEGKRKVISTRCEKIFVYHTASAEFYSLGFYCTFLSSSTKRVDLMVCDLL